MRFAPASLLVAYCWLAKEPRCRGAGARTRRSLIAAWIAVLGYLPYWLWPDTGSRYVMPLYPLAAYLIAARALAADRRAHAQVVHCLFATIAFKYVAALWVYPAYLREHRGDYSRRRGRNRRAGKGMPLYATDVSATGLSIVANLDARRFPQQPLQWPPREWTSGFVLSNKENPELGSAFRKFRLGRKTCTCYAAALRATRPHES